MFVSPLKDKGQKRVDTRQIERVRTCHISKGRGSTFQTLLCSWEQTLKQRNISMYWMNPASKSSGVSRTPCDYMWAWCQIVRLRAGLLVFSSFGFHRKWKCYFYLHFILVSLLGYLELEKYKIYYQLPSSDTNSWTFQYLQQKSFCYVHTDFPNRQRSLLKTAGTSFPWGLCHPIENTVLI